MYIGARGTTRPRSRDVTPTLGRVFSHRAACLEDSVTINPPQLTPPRLNTDESIRYQARALDGGSRLDPVEICSLFRFLEVADPSNSDKGTYSGYYLDILIECIYYR
jgi:hypothetical protein